MILGAYVDKSVREVGILDHYWFELEVVVGKTGVHKHLVEYTDRGGQKVIAAVTIRATSVLESASYGWTRSSLEGSKSSPILPVPVVL